MPRDKIQPIFVNPVYTPPPTQKIEQKSNSSTKKNVINLKIDVDSPLQSYSSNSSGNMSDLGDEKVPAVPETDLSIKIVTNTMNCSPSCVRAENNLDSTEKKPYPSISILNPKISL